MMHVSSNPPLKTAIAWVIITLLAILGVFTPSALGISGFDGGFAISAISILLAITGIIVVIVYLGRARLLDGIINGKNVLVHWTYSTDEWQKFSEREFQEEKKLKKGLFYVISGIAFIIGIAFFLIDNKAGLWVLVGMLALIAVMAFTAWFSTIYNYRQNKRYHGQAYITKKAVYLNRQLHTWGGPGDRLESMDLEKTDATQLLLKFKYSAITRTGTQQQIVSVPVPAGKENEAEELVNKFNRAELR